MARPPEVQTSSTIFLILRRMRAPLIVLIVIFSVSVLGLTLVPGVDANGEPWRMSFFDALYFMSYTATTIGFGEIPHALTVAQRMWVTFAIYLSVIGWAYAIGSLLSLGQDRGFRAALASQRFGRRVARLREPFLLLAGYGQTGQIVGQALDADGRRFTVVDLAQDRVDTLDVESFRSDVPGLAGDAGVTENLQRAGLAHRGCAGVLALTNDDAANLSVVMAAALLRPDLPVVARTVSPSIARRMRDFGTPAVVNPYDDFGDHLRVALRAPATYQLTDWLTSPPGSELPPRQQPPPRGPWTVLSTSRFGMEVTADLRADGLPVGIVDVDDVAAEDGPDLDDELHTALAGAVGFVAAADDDLLNLSALQLARQRNPQLFVIARQNDPANAPLLRALSPDVLLVAAEVIAHEVLARLGSPTLWAFLRDVRGRDDAWAGRLLDRLTGCCGSRVPSTWQVDLTAVGAPALAGRLAVARVPLEDLLRSPDDRARPLDAVPLLLVRDGERLLTPELDRPVQPGDTLLLAGRPGDRRALDATLRDAATSSYVITGEQVPTTWLGRQLRRGGSDAGDDSDFRIESH